MANGILGDMPATDPPDIGDGTTFGILGLASQTPEERQAENERRRADLFMQGAWRFLCTIENPDTRH